MQANENTRILDHYHQCGFKMVRLSADAKRASDAEWQKRDFPLEEHKRHVARGGNIALQMGTISDLLGCVEVDCPEAVALAPKFLPETLTAGRNGEPRHYFYRSPELGYKKFSEGTEELMAVKASDNDKGHYVAVAPSRHPDKGNYLWRPSFNPAAIAEVPAHELKKRAELLAVAALVARRLPPEGRHHLAMCLAGYMLRNGETEEDVLKVLEAAWSYHNAPRKAFQDLRGVVPDTAENLELGEPVTGGRVLEELMPGLPKKIAKFLGWEQVNYDGASFAVLGRLKRPGSFNLTEMGNAERFVADHGGNVRYCYAWSRWLVWTGVRWERDEGGKVHRLAKETVRGIYQEAAAAADENRRKALAQHATRSEAEAKIRAMLELAKSEVPVSTDELDANPWLLNCNNGTIDLRTGELREHRREDLITKLAPVDYDADAEAPEWAKFLADVLPSVALRAFVQRAAGYSLTADTRERILFILHGMGRNGKSTFLEALREVLGADDGYAMKTPAETLMAKPTGGIPNDVARLNGARFVSAAETEANRRLAEALVKEITGNDTISARFMRAEWFDFKPTHKVWLATNHKPEIKGTDPAIWDRIRLVPFTVRIPDDAVDLALPGKLKAEIAGILSWAVEGCLEWQREGLGNPEEVRAATDAYRQEMDTLARFIEDRCVLAPNAQVDATPLFNAFKEWCVDVNETPGSQKSFGMRLKERGFEDDRDSRTRRKVWRGIGLFTDVPDPDGASFNTSSNDRGSVNAKRSTNSKRSETVFEHNPARQEFSSGYTEKRFRMVSQGKTVSQGEPDNGSKQPHAPAHENLLQAFFEDPPAWFVRQGGHALKHYPDLPERILKPLASSVAYEVLNDPHKGGQALPLVRTKLEEMRP